MEWINSYFDVVIVGICLCTGYMIKNLIPTECVNKYIPIVMGCLGLALSIVTNLDSINLSIILEGLFSGLASTGLYETFANLLKKSGTALFTTEIERGDIENEDK